MKIRFEHTGTFQLVPLTSATKKIIRHFDINELINIAKLCWEISNYKGNFQIVDENTGEIICTLFYEKPIPAPKGFSQDEIGQILVSVTKKQLEEISQSFLPEDAEHNKSYLSKADGVTDLVLELLEDANFGDPKMFAEKSYVDMILDLWKDISDEYERLK